MGPDSDPEGVVRVRAGNASPMTLDGTNTYLAGGWAIDPGPDDQAHLEKVLEAAGGRLDGIAITHAHPDHSAGAPTLATLAGGVPVVHPGDGDVVGPFKTIATPGHAPDHVCLLMGPICFAGDMVMGVGSVFVDPREGSLAAYLDSLHRLRALEPEVLCPGHGPYIRDPAAKIDEYVAHRLRREEMLLEALAAGARTEQAMLDHAWADIGPELRPAAALTLRAHLDKLAGEGRLPADMRE